MELISSTTQSTFLQCIQVLQWITSQLRGMGFYVVLKDLQGTSPMLYMKEDTALVFLVKDL